MCAAKFPVAPPNLPNTGIPWVAVMMRSARTRNTQNSCPMVVGVAVCPCVLESIGTDFHCFDFFFRSLVISSNCGVSAAIPSQRVIP